MLLSCVQTDVTLADIKANTDRVLRWIDVVQRAGVDLAVFPECVLSGYGFESRDEAFAQAITITDPVWQTLANRCRQAGNLSLVIGFLESETCEDGTKKLYNASAVVGPEGVVASYRKVHLPKVGADRFVDRGNRPYAVHQVGEARVGLAICYDCSFPEPMRLMGLAGADVIALPTNWPIAAKRTAEIVPPARSMENHIYFAAANRVGTERGFRYCGMSSIHGPDGVELAAAVGDEETVLFAEIDLAHARNKRIERTPGAHSIDRFADRQPDFY
jgi:predicted amidohydrolase